MFKKILLLLITFSFFLFNSVKAEEDFSDVQKVRSGTFLKVLNLAEISTLMADAEDEVMFLNLNDMYVYENKVFPANTKIYGEVEEVLEPVAGRDAAIKISIHKMITPDKKVYKVKGHIYILEALKKLIDDGINAKLIIAGTGDYEDTIREKIKELSLGKNVVMAGFIKDVTGFMNVLDVSVNASFGTEATSLALLEGMSIGIPAVVSDFGGNPGVIYEGENGYLFPTKNSHVMYEKLKKVINEGNALKENCKKIFNERFKAEIMTSKIEKLYEELL